MLEGHLAELVEINTTVTQTHKSLNPSTQNRTNCSSDAMGSLVPIWVFLSVFHKRRDEKISTCNWSDINPPSYTHVSKHTHTQTESQGSWLWPNSCRVYEVQGAPVPQRGCKEAIKMLTDSMVPACVLTGISKNMWHLNRSTKHTWHSQTRGNIHLLL